MARTLIQLKNGLRVKHLVKPKKYFLFMGNQQIRIDSQWQRGVDTFDEAVTLGNSFIANFGDNFITK